MDKIYKLDKDGNVVTLYDDSLIALGLGSLRVHRASNVTFKCGKWRAKLTNTACNKGAVGCELEACDTREAAIKAECDFLQKLI